MANKLSIDNLQAGYINIAREIGGDRKAALAFDSVGKLMAGAKNAKEFLPSVLLNVRNDTGSKASNAVNGDALRDVRIVPHAATEVGEAHTSETSERNIATGQSEHSSQEVVDQGVSEGLGGSRSTRTDTTAVVDTDDTSRRDAALSEIIDEARPTRVETVTIKTEVTKSGLKVFGPNPSERAKAIFGKGSRATISRESALAEPNNRSPSTEDTPRVTTASG